MATSLSNVDLPRGTRVDLYAATGIAGGTKLTIQNIGRWDAWLVESAAAPTIATTGYNKVKKDKYAQNKTGNVGAWAISLSGSTLHVEEA